MVERITVTEQAQLRQAIEEQRLAVLENTKEVSALRETMAIHNAKQQSFETLVSKHEAALYGDGEGKKGYLQRFDVLEEKAVYALKGINTALWVIITTALGSAVLYWIEIFKAGLSR
jgi:hypothetical protein